MGRIAKAGAVTVRSYSSIYVVSPVRIAKRLPGIRSSRRATKRPASGQHVGLPPVSLANF